MHLLFHAQAALPGTIHALLAMARTTGDGHTGGFAVIGELLVGGIVLIACSAYGLRHSR